MKKISLEKVSITKINQLQLIGKQTFAEAFSSNNSAENIAAYLSSEFSIEKLSIQLSDQDCAFYFALFEDNIIGYLKTNFGHSQTETNHNNSLEIERIYVLKEFYGKNVGQLLLEKAIEISKEKEVDYVWLGVWEKNPRAIRFYQKNGFIAFDKHSFILGDEEQIDILMKLEIN